MGYIARAIRSPTRRASNVVLFFVGDQLTPDIAPPLLLSYQSPMYLFSMLAHRFPTSGVIVLVYPAVVNPAGFSVYSQFVPSVNDRTGDLGGEVRGKKAWGYDSSSLTALRTLYDMFAFHPPTLQSDADSHPVVTDELGEPFDLHQTISNDRAPFGEEGEQKSRPEEPSTGEVYPDISLVGFSKGGIVLNQVLAELCSSSLSQEDFKEEALMVQAPSPSRASSSGNPSTVDGGVQTKERRALLWAYRSIRALHYIDCGLNCRGGYFCDRRMIHTLKSNLGVIGERENGTRPGEDARASSPSTGQGNLFRVTLTGTWRQWADPTRPFLNEERRHLHHWLTEVGIPVTMREFTKSELPLNDPSTPTTVPTLDAFTPEQCNPRFGKGGSAPPTPLPLSAGLLGDPRWSPALVGLLAHMQSLAVFCP
jgi:hypothetical protein